MAGGVLAMSALERERLVVLAEVAAKGVSQRRAAERLGICVRQVKRLVRAYRDGGAGGLVSRQRGRASNHQLAAGVGERARDLLGGKYRDFGPRSWRSWRGSRSRARACGNCRSSWVCGSLRRGGARRCFNSASGVRALAS